MVVAPDTSGCAFVEPAVVTSRWELRLGPPLMTPACSYPSYLPSILIGFLKNGLLDTCHHIAGLLPQKLDIGYRHMHTSVTDNTARGYRRLSR